MRHLRLFCIMFVFITSIACTSQPEFTRQQGKGGSTAAKNDGGSDGGSAGGSKNEGGNGQGGSTPEPEWFSCRSVADGSLLVAIEVPQKEPGHIAIDGWMTGMGDWGTLHIESDPNAKRTKKDFGPKPSGIYFEMNPGYSLNGKPYAIINRKGGEEIIGVTGGHYLCPNGNCKGNILCCHGKAEIGRLQNGTISGGLQVEGANVLCNN